MKDVIVAVLACNSGRHAYISSKSSNSLLVITSDINDGNLSLLLWRIKIKCKTAKNRLIISHFVEKD
ncbi:MAG: hypothetical protein KBA82_12580 [Nitrosomonas sp.]|jgi:hypothetical protein|nr:hypothetical protein [Nitrosomonas sp.]MBP7113762.1 hypothetical protein [Nitrosomonas sp.]